MVLRTSCILCLGVSLSLAAKKPITIDTLVQSPRAKTAPEVIWAPDGKRFAYEESRKLWIYDAVSGNKRQALDLAKLDQAAAKVEKDKAFDWTNRRVGEEDLQWFHSGRKMLISQGGDLFVADIENGSFEQLTATPETESDPKLSPDNRLVSFRRGHDLFTLDLSRKDLHQLTHDGAATLLNGQMDWVYPEELELATAHWWSPDSRSIAYLQFDIGREPVFPQVSLLNWRSLLEPERYPQAGDPNADVRVGVVPAEGGRTRWMDLGETRGYLIARVKWLPYENTLAVERLNRVQNRLDLMLADAATGASRVLLHEEDPYWINIEGEPLFSTDGKRFLWTSERDGFRHIYLYEANGKLVKELTRGEWEVETIAGVNEKAREVYFISTEQSPVNRDLYAVSFDGKKRRLVSSAEGTHEVSMSPTGQYYLDTFSSTTKPPRSTVHDAGGAELNTFREADTRVQDEYQILPAQILKVKAPDGALLYARLIKPANFNARRKYPAVVMVYGGPHAQMVEDRWSGANWDQVMAHRGFVVWQLDNRGSSGRGHKWESVIYHNLGAHELEDQKTGVRYLESLGFVDTSRIGMYGWSYGGFMTLYSLCNAPGLFRAGIAGAPVTDWRNYDTIYTERYMGLPEENAEAYSRSSPLGAARNLTAKLMLVHNIEDDNVHFQNTLQMADALERANKQFQMLVYPQKAHAVTGEVRRHLLESTTTFFEQALQ